MKEEGERAVKYEAIIFLFVFVRRCVRWISVGGLCTRYFCFSLHFYIYLSGA